MQIDCSIFSPSTVSWNTSFVFNNPLYLSIFKLQCAIVNARDWNLAELVLKHKFGAMSQAPLSHAGTFLLSYEVKRKCIIYEDKQDLWIFSYLKLKWSAYNLTNIPNKHVCMCPSEDKVRFIIVGVPENGS